MGKRDWYFCILYPSKLNDMGARISFIRFSLILIILIYTHNSSWGQKAPVNESPKHRIGFISGVGDQAIFPARYSYEVVLFQFEYAYRFSQNEKWTWEAVLQPQYNLSNFTKVEVFEEITLITENVGGKEYGLSAGLLARTNIYKDIIGFYSIIGAGPHFITDSPRRQAKGFIFSTYLDFGFTVKLVNKTYFDLRPGFRHISNANTKFPNMGINTFTLSAGMMVEI